MSKLSGFVANCRKFVAKFFNLYGEFTAIMSVFESILNLQLQNLDKNFKKQLFYKNKIKI